MRGWEIVAHNTATASNNKIHDDAVARSLGFGGGLVPGVDVYAYLCHPPAEAWGLDWLARGTMQARFHQPVYDGALTTIRAEEDEIGTVTLAAIDPSGVHCAEATATLDSSGATAPDPAGWPDVTQVEAAARPPASPNSLAAGTALALTPHRFVAGKAGLYLDDIREPLALYRDERVAHPAWILRKANEVLAANVVLGPWIHVESTAQHLGLVRDGATVATRAIVAKEWEHRGHAFVTLDVVVLADGAPAARFDHTAIYRPRQLAG